MRSSLRCPPVGLATAQAICRVLPRGFCDVGFLVGRQWTGFLRVREFPLPVITNAPYSFGAGTVAPVAACAPSGSSLTALHGL